MSFGAEGATAPETLRQKDRRGMNLWKADRLYERLVSPTGVSGAFANPAKLFREISQVPRQRGRY